MPPWALEGKKNAAAAIYETQLTARSSKGSRGMRSGRRGRPPSATKVAAGHFLADQTSKSLASKFPRLEQRSGGGSRSSGLSGRPPWQHAAPEQGSRPPALPAKAAAVAARAAAMSGAPPSTAEKQEMAARLSQLRGATGVYDSGRAVRLGESRAKLKRELATLDEQLSAVALQKRLMALQKQEAAIDDEVARLRKEADEEMLEQAQDGEMNNCVSQAMQDQLRDTLGLTPAYLVEMAANERLQRRRGQKQEKAQVSGDTFSWMPAAEAAVQAASPSGRRVRSNASSFSFPLKLGLAYDREVMVTAQTDLDDAARLTVHERLNRLARRRERLAEEKAALVAKTKAAAGDGEGGGGGEAEAEAEGEGEGEGNEGGGEKPEAEEEEGEGDGGSPLGDDNPLMHLGEHYNPAARDVPPQWVDGSDHIAFRPPSTRIVAGKLYSAANLPPHLVPLPPAPRLVVEQYVPLAKLVSDDRKRVHEEIAGALPDPGSMAALGASHADGGTRGGMTSARAVGGVHSQLRSFRNMIVEMSKAQRSAAKKQAAAAAAAAGAGPGPGAGAGDDQFQRQLAATFKSNPGELDKFVKFTLGDRFVFNNQDGRGGRLGGVQQGTMVGSRVSGPRVRLSSLKDAVKAMWNETAIYQRQQK